MTTVNRTRSMLGASLETHAQIHDTINAWTPPNWKLPPTTRTPALAKEQDTCKEQGKDTNERIKTHRTHGQPCTFIQHPQAVPSVSRICCNSQICHNNACLNQTESRTFDIETQCTCCELSRHHKAFGTWCRITLKRLILACWALCVHMGPGKNINRTETYW